MSGVLNQIRSWAAVELKYWEQAALEKISNETELAEEGFQELLQLFKEDAGLVPLTTTRTRLSFPDNLTSETILTACRLERLFNLRNVNALPDGQDIIFGTQLTLIYGNNGAGKTGYVRPLASAGFTRGERQVLPNATRTDQKGPPQADIEISRNGMKQVITWTNGQRCPELAGLYIFDGDSLIAHLTRSNSLSFSPSGLSLLTRLAEVTDEVRERIRREIEERERPHNFSVLFEGQSEISKHVTSLDAQTDCSALESLAALSDEEKLKSDHLDREVARLKLLDIPTQIAKRSQEISDLQSLVESIQRAQIALGDSAEEGIRGLVDHVRALRNEVESSGIKQFTFAEFTHIGGAQWLDFLNASKALGDAEVKRGAAYPQPGDHCLLCRQALSSEATNLIRRLWEFLGSNSQARLEAAERACIDRMGQMERVSLNYFMADSNVRRLVEGELSIIIPAIEAQIEACAARRQEMVESLRSYQLPIVPPLIHLDVTDLEKLMQLRREEIESLRNSDAVQQLTIAENLQRQLKHRRMLGEKLSALKSYVAQRKWAVKARQSLGSTRTITTKYNELFMELVTERYVLLFEETLRRFKSNIRVTIETRGLKGETVRQIVLRSNQCDYPIDQILSEGEKRAVGIADFLTEVTLDHNSNAVILDDPVTSLDCTWKDTLALCLVEHAKRRQVIIFTHDLSFLYRIKAHANKLAADVVNHWIREEDGTPGFTYINDSPVCEKDFKSARIARELYSKAKDMAPGNQQSILQQGFGALRTSYEALIIFDLFNEVVGRFEERISFGRLKDVHIDQGLIEKIIKRMEILSQYIDAHLHSDAFASAKPTPSNLLEEILAFEDIRKKQQELKKESKSGNIAER